MARYYNIERERFENIEPMKTTKNKKKKKGIPFKDKIIYTLGAFTMWPMIFDNPGSEVSKMGKWGAIRWALRKIWIEEDM